MNKVNIRPYSTNDYPRLLDLQKSAFPPPFPEELWWNLEQIKAHTTTFPAGALVAEMNGQLVGSATSLIVQYDQKPHTWAQIADNGYIQATHNECGDSLYGIDLCVRPNYRRQGIAQALYEARKETVKNLKLKRFLAGCRIPNFHLYKDKLDVKKFVDAVVSGEINDPVLSFMLKQDLHPIQILPNYVDDAESCHYAVLVEWTPSTT